MESPAAAAAPRVSGRSLIPLAAWVLAVDAWFGGPVAGAGGRIAAAVFAAVALAAVLRRPRPARPTPDALPLLAACIVATLVRLPALFAPYGLVTSDSAVAGIIAQEIAAGEPAPAYAFGFAYEGTLKAHLTAALARLLPFAGTPFVYALASHLFYLGWVVAVVLLARDAAGRPAAWAAGLFMALPSRFVVAFSVNNVGQYPEFLALGTLALAALARGGFVVAGFLLGLALWQQLVAVYFVLTAAFGLLVVPAWRTPRVWGKCLLGFAAGSYPIWLWNAAHQWATFDFFRRGGKNPADRFADLPERFWAAVSVSLPKLLGLRDLDIGAPYTWIAVLAVLAATVALLVHAARRAAAPGRGACLLALALLVVSLGVFSASKFSHRGAQRPRYLLPVYAPVALAAGIGYASLRRRGRLVALVPAAAVLAFHAAGVFPWLTARRAAHQRDAALVRTLLDAGVRTGYSGFWVGPKYTFLSERRVVLSPELGPEVSWVHPRYSAMVAEAGPDGVVVEGEELAAALRERLAGLGVDHAEVTSSHTVFYRFSRRIALDELHGYDMERSLGSVSSGSNATDD
jgi:4-amino-4-deoxy-L-arabinose transferase-like glycosyltransferase